MATGTPPSDDGSRRRVDRLHGVVAGAVAVLAVLVGIVLVNLLNDPSEDSSTASSTSTPSPTTTVAPPGSSGGAASRPGPPETTASALDTTRPPTATAPPATATATAPGAAPSATPQRVFTTVTIFNDSRIPGLAQEAVAPVEAAGFTVNRVGNFQSVYDTPVTTVFYDPEDEAAARTMLDVVPGVERMVPRSETSILTTGTLILVVTRDFPVNSE